MKKGLLLALFCILIDFSFGQTMLDLSGDYFGQTAPQDKPLIFGDDYVSTSGIEHSSPTFSLDGDELYWSKIVISNDSVFQLIMCSKRISGNWTKPTIAPFSKERLYEGGLIISADNKRLYFYRGQPAAVNKDVESNEIICYSKKGNQWVNPKVICSGFSPSVTNNGTIYFDSDEGISKISFNDGKMASIQLLDDKINLKGYKNWTPYIAPDESYLIFSRLDYNGDYGELMISFRNIKTGVWSEPINMGSPINTWAQERFPSVTQDGKYLFFTRWTQNNNQDIFWVSSEVIERLKEKTE
ncbi:MAG: PD40 domain-containing protein [Bacteroidales bacterium]|nr:PD40 domain-containing protein [Bacteroidales bacterium]